MSVSGVRLSSIAFGVDPTSLELLCAPVVSGSVSAIVVLIYRPGSGAITTTFFVDLAETLDRVVGFFNSVTYPYPCITLVLNSIRVSPWVFQFLGFLEPYSVFLNVYTHAIQMTEVLLLLLLLLVRQHHLRALFY